MKIIFRIRFAAIIIAAITFMCGLVDGQTLPNVQVFVTLNSPSPYLSDWQSRASTAMVTVVNTGAAFPSKIWVEFFLNGSKVAYSQPAKLPVRPISTGSNIFNGEQLVPLQAVHFENNVDQNSQRAGRIPDGNVCLVVHVQELDPKTGIATGREAVSPPGMGCSIILSYSPPVLILPADNSELCKLGNNNVIDKNNGQPMPMFQWTPIVPAPPFELEPVRYHFAIYEVLPGQSPIAAFRGARSVFETGTSIPDLNGLTNLLWPIQYFLPEKGKTYVWSVRALDPHGNPFVLTNDGWATPFTFKVPPNCDQSGSGGKLSDVLLINPPVIDFGSVNLGTTSELHQISLTNIGTGTLSLHPVNIIPPGGNVGFSIDLQPSFLVLEPGMSTAFNVSFKPTAIGMADGSVRIATDGGTAQIELKGQGIDTKAPTVKIISPSGGENITPGSQFAIKFTASDNDALSNYKIEFSSDGGISFPSVITPSDNTFTKPPQVLWNVPADLQTSQGIIKISAQDKSGNSVSAFSGLFSVGNGTGNTGANTTGNTNTNGTTGFNGIINTTNNWMFVPLGMQILGSDNLPTGIDEIRKRLKEIYNGPDNSNSTNSGSNGGSEKGNPEHVEIPPLSIPPDLMIPPSNNPEYGGGIKIDPVSPSAPLIPGVTFPESVINDLGQGYRYGGKDWEKWAAGAWEYDPNVSPFDHPSPPAPTEKPESVIDDLGHTPIHFSMMTSGKGDASYFDASGAKINATIVFPENMDFVAGDNFLHSPSLQSIGDGAVPPNTPKVHLQGIGVTGDSPIDVLFNPKEYSIDKSVPWRSGGGPGHEHGDAPPPEFKTPAMMNLTVELMFDSFEEKRSIKPDVQKFLQWMGVHTDKYGRVKVQFHWDREGKNGADLKGLDLRFTMFLPDGTPCRAVATLHLQHAVIIVPHSKKGGGKAAGTDAGGYETMFIPTTTDTKYPHIYQHNQTDLEFLLKDPVLSSQEKALRTVIRGLDRSHRLTRTKTQGDINLANRFSVEIDGVVTQVHNVEGFETESDVVEYKDGEDGVMHTRPGNHKPGKITITKDWSNTSEWYNWRKSVTEGKTERKSISVIFHNDAGEEAMRYNFFDCFPVKYEVPQLNAKNSGHATEKIEISYESVDMQPSAWHVSGDLKSAQGGMSQSAQEMTLLMPMTIAGVKSNAILIGLLLPPQNTAPPTNTNDRTDINLNTNGWKWKAIIPNPAAGSFGSAEGIGSSTEGSKGGGRGYVGGNFALDLDGKSAGIIQKIDGVIGEVSNGKPAPITMDILPTDKVLYQWIGGSFDGSHSRRNGAIIAADFNYKSREIREFQDALITEIGFPALDGASKDPAYINIKFDPERIRIKKDSSKSGSGKYANDAKVQKKWTPSNFRLKIDGLEEPCTKVNKIEAITIKQKNTKNNEGSLRSSNTADCSQIAGSILGSPEYRTKFVRDYYQTYLHRSPNPSESAQMSQLLAGGETAESLKGIILGSPEYFTSQCGGTNSGFATHVYHDLLNRPADQAAIASANGLANSSSARQQFVQAIIGSQEYRTIVIQNIYQTYLGRSANPSEISQWLNILQNGQSSEQLKAVIMGSQEYRTKNSSVGCLSALYTQLLGRPATAIEQAQENSTSSATRQPVTIYIPESVAEPFYHWLEKSSMKNGTLDYQSDDGSTLFTLTFHNLNIFKMTPDKVESHNDNIRRIKIEMYCETMKFDYNPSVGE